MFNKIFISVLLVVFISCAVFYVSYYKKRTRAVLKENIDKFMNLKEIERALEWQAEDEVLITLFVNMSFDGFFYDLHKFFKSEFKVYRINNQIIVEAGLGVQLKINLAFDKVVSSVYLLLDTKGAIAEDIYKFLSWEIPLNILVENNATEDLKLMNTILVKNNKDFSFILKQKLDEEYSLADINPIIFNNCHAIFPVKIDDNLDRLSLEKKLNSLGKKIINFTENKVILDDNDDMFEIVKNLDKSLVYAEENKGILIIGHIKSKNLALAVDQSLVSFNKKRIKFEIV
ncbi:MAG: hypothetical protein GY817_07625 [bacterium]|nr:hypothetical protein [bacterium]